MQQILFEYEMNPTTWVYVSSLMLIGIYFKFHRFWSVRNLDLLGLIAFAPALLLLSHDKEQLGYVWLFIVSGCFVPRLLLDPLMVRRPLLEPNLSASGLTFTGVALLVFLMANVIIGKVPDENLRGTRPTTSAVATSAVAATEPSSDVERVSQRLAGFRPFFVFAERADRTAEVDRAAAPLSRQQWTEIAIMCAVAILGHLAIVLGMVLVGYRHFDNTYTGVAAASLYLLLPYTAQLTREVNHIIPGAILVWAVQCYRRPLFSGILLGLAAGLVYYPWFLLPLWVSFYWRRGLGRFLIGVLGTLAVMVIVLSNSAENFSAFLDAVKQMFGWTVLAGQSADGFWAAHPSAYRYPILAVFLGLCGILALWPAQKNLGTLLSLSTLVLVTAQFWNPHQGGLYMGWYLPLLILTIFRPNLEDRVAVTAVLEARVPGFLRRLFRLPK